MAEFLFFKLCRMVRALDRFSLSFTWASASIVQHVLNSNARVILDLLVIFLIKQNRKNRFTVFTV